MINIRRLFVSVCSFYYEGFKEMTWGRVLWAIILIKLFVMFVILKLFFFPDYVKMHADEGEEAQFVSEELMERVPSR